MPKRSTLSRIRGYGVYTVDFLRKVDQKSSNLVASGVGVLTEAVEQPRQNMGAVLAGLVKSFGNPIDATPMLDAMKVWFRNKIDHFRGLFAPKQDKGQVAVPSGDSRTAEAVKSLTLSQLAGATGGNNLGG